jgi:hypothetical protein
LKGEARSVGAWSGGDENENEAEEEAEADEEQEQAQEKAEIEAQFKIRRLTDSGAVHP